MFCHNYHKVTDPKLTVWFITLRRRFLILRRPTAFFTTNCDKSDIKNCGKNTDISDTLACGSCTTSLFLQHFYGK